MGANEARYRKAEQALWRAEGASPTEHQVRLPKLGTTVRVQELGDGSPVLFVHGAGNGGTSWAPLAARLPGFRNLLLDRPGCGLSERARAEPYDDFADGLLVDVLDGLGVERAAVVSTSLGGYHALRTAAARPDRVSSVVELGWTIGAPIGRTPLIMRLTALPFLGRSMTKLPVTRGIARSMLAQVGLRQAIEAGRVRPEVIDWFRAQLNDTDTLRNELEDGPAVIDFRRGLNESLLLPDELLGRIAAPVLFLWGADDLFGGPEIAGPFVGRIPRARLELVPGAGHAVWMDDPDGIAQSVRTYLTATAGAA